MAASQLVYKHSISTIMPQRPPADSAVPIAEGGMRSASLQDLFLAAAAREQGADDLVPGQWRHAAGRRSPASTNSRVLLERGGQVQLVYKHAISTLQPPHPLDLGDARAQRIERRLSASTIAVNDVARGERAVVVVPERAGEGARRSTEARLEEAEGLAEAIGIDVVARKAFRVRAGPAGDLARQGPGRGDRRDRQRQ